MVNGEGCVVRGDPPAVERISSVVPYVDEGFAEFYRSEYRKVVALGIALTGSLELGEEIAQEAFLAAHRKWARVSGYDRPAAFVRRVAVNLAVSSTRRRRREALALQRLFHAVPHETASQPEAAPGEAFWITVRSLPRRQRQVI